MWTSTQGQISRLLDGVISLNVSFSEAEIKGGSTWKEGIGCRFQKSFVSSNVIRDALLYKTKSFFICK